MPDIDDNDHQSGVTISTGVDLGARNLSDLQRLNLEPELIEKFVPYLGKKKAVARRFLADNPLEISPKQALDLYQKVKKSSTALLVEKYNLGSKTKMHFYCLPREAQTVIASLYYQYQDKLLGHDSWGDACNQDWSALHKRLLNYKDIYGSRRGREADVLKRLL